jgi:protein ImuA
MGQPVLAPRSVGALRRRIAEIEGRPLASIRLNRDAGDAGWEIGGTALDRRSSASRPHKRGQSPGRAGPVLPFDVPAIDRVFARGGLACDALHEIHVDEMRSAGESTGFLTAFLARLARRQDGFILWARDAASPCEVGNIGGAGLARFGLDPGRIVSVSCRRVGDLLWTLEEGLACRGLIAVIGEVRGDPQLLDLTATRRLALRARTAGIPAVLHRFGARMHASATASRWRIEPRPATGPGRACWHLELSRNREGPCGAWTLEWHHGDRSFALAATHRVDLAATPGDRSAGAAELGQVVALERVS